MNIFFSRHVVRHLEPQCDVCTKVKVSSTGIGFVIKSVGFTLVGEPA